MGDAAELLIARVGAQGDGVSEGEGAPIFVPFTLPGERVLADVTDDRGKLVEVLEASALRATPVCRHFGVCGGCSVQHMGPDLYADWKRGLVGAAFRARGLDVDIGALVQPGGKRRRGVFTVRRTDGGIEIGFHESASHAVVAIDECPVLEPKIVAALAGLRRLLEPVLTKRGEARVTVTLTDTGVDADVSGIGKSLAPAVRTQLAAQAAASGFVRVAIDDDVIFETLPPRLGFAGVDVAIPPGVFLQAVAAAEGEIARRCIEAVGKAKSVVDLFSGVGTLTFPLARTARVAAFDGDEVAIKTLVAACKHAKGLKPITAKVRDLFRDSLSPLELNEHEAIVFDPPRAGAEAQAKKIARSKVKTVVAVSCNAATLARDARHLVDGGYKIESVTPIDQFVYSAHVEVVAVFRR